MTRGTAPFFHAQVLGRGVQRGQGRVRTTRFTHLGCRRIRSAGLRTPDLENLGQWFQRARRCKDDTNSSSFARPRSWCLILTRRGARRASDTSSMRLTGRLSACLARRLCRLQPSSCFRERPPPWRATLTYDVLAAHLHASRAGGVKRPFGGPSGPSSARGAWVKAFGSRGTVGKTCAVNVGASFGRGCSARTWKSGLSAGRGGGCTASPGRRARRTRCARADCAAPRSTATVRASGVGRKSDVKRFEGGGGTAKSNRDGAACPGGLNG